MNACCQPAQEPLGLGHLAVVDGDPALPRLLAHQFEQTGELWRVTAYRTGAEALAGVAAAPPQVVLMEQTLSDGCGIQWAGRLKSRHPQLPVVIHTAQGCPEKLYQALRLSLLGYVVKRGEETDWSTHLRKALAGRFALCAEAERLLPRVFARLGPGNPWNLSRREREVLHCLCGGLSDKEIAASLGISDETVHVHLRHAFHKLGVHDRTAAVRKFMQMWPGGGGGGVKMAGRDFDKTNPFLTLLAYCVVRGAKYSQAVKQHIKYQTL